MNYPSDFDAPAFPAGRSIAISRFMAIASCVMFLLVIFMCALLLWAVRSQRVDPFIVSINNITGQWTTLDHSHKNGPIEYTALESLQQSVLGNFVANWFTISGDDAANERMWKTCERRDDYGINATRPYGDTTCALYCASGGELFARLIKDIVPGYQLRVANGERWMVDKAQIQMQPAGEINENGGTWRVLATIQSNINGDMTVIGFAKIVRNIDSYPLTLGYYVADFNAYKIGE